MRKSLKTLTAMTALLAMSAGSALAKGPGDGKPLTEAHPAYTVEQARPDDFKPSVGALCFLPNGKLAVTEFIPMNNGDFREEYNGSLYIIDNPTEKDPSKITVKKISEDLHDPLGMYYLDGALYICDRNEVSKWTDTDDDGYPDKRESFASGWISDNYHHFTFGLPYHDGHFYLTLSTNITFNKMIERENIKGKIESLNGPNPEHRGCLLKIDAKTGEWEIVVGGLRTPNGVSLGPDGEILIPDNQGAWKPASGIYVAEQGAFYGHYNNTTATSDFYPDGGVPSAFSDKPITPPAIWVPQNECANSPGEMIQIPEDYPHAGQYIMAEITKGGLRRVCLEEVDGTWQGAIFRFSQGLESGINRLEWGPDGCLYAGGMGSRGNWGWKAPGESDTRRFGLQRMRLTGEAPFEYDKIEATKNGFRLSFTKPVKKNDLQELAKYTVHEWTYKQTPRYGGPKINNKQITPAQAIAAEDGLSVELIIPDRKPNHVYHIRSGVESAEGEAMWTTEAWYTFHKAPAE